MMLSTHKELSVIAFFAAGLSMIPACTSPIKKLPRWEQAEILQSAREEERQTTPPWENDKKLSAEDIALYRKAAEQGDATAQYFLGSGYDYGEGTPQDYEQAVMWYRKSAEQGNLGAQFQLSCMYAIGRGVPVDFVLAYMWANLAAAYRSPIAFLAVIQRNEFTKTLSPSQIEEGQRLTREWMAAHPRKEAKPT